jgi:hypothetical protein
MPDFSLRLRYKRRSFGNSLRARKFSAARLRLAASLSVLAAVAGLGIRFACEAEFSPRSGYALAN